MTDFKTYYNNKFREDINQFFSTIPDNSKYHEDPQNKQILSIQYQRLTPAFDHLNFLNDSSKELFAIALFFTVLADMVCFSHFNINYTKFQNLTRYPKFIGNCPSLCNYHLHPREIFLAMNKERSINQNHLLFYEKFDNAVETMKEETIIFFNQYMKEVDGEYFWVCCKNEFPFK